MNTQTNTHIGEKQASNMCCFFFEKRRVWLWNALFMLYDAPSLPPTQKKTKKQPCSSDITSSSVQMSAASDIEQLSLAGRTTKHFLPVESEFTGRHAYGTLGEKFLPPPPSKSTIFQQSSYRAFPTKVKTHTLDALKSIFQTHERFGPTDTHTHPYVHSQEIFQWAKPDRGHTAAGTSAQCMSEKLPSLYDSFFSLLFFFVLFVSSLQSLAFQNNTWDFRDGREGGGGRGGVGGLNRCSPGARGLFIYSVKCFFFRRFLGPWLACFFCFFSPGEL